MRKFIFMVTLTLCAAIGLSVYNSIANKAVGPEVATTLALEQFAEPSVQTDTAQRMWNGLDVTSYVNIGSIIFVCGMWVVSYRKEIIGIGKVVVE